MLQVRPSFSHETAAPSFHRVGLEYVIYYNVTVLCKIKSACLCGASGILCVHLLILVFALLVSNTAGSLASGLAGGLAFAAAAVLYALNEVTGSEGTNSLHCNVLLLGMII